MSKSPAAVHDVPTLGRAVILGELYDQRSSKFLGVQLYPREKIKTIVTGVKKTNLTVGLSTTHEARASQLNISPRLSLDIFGGLVKVSGSALYLNDEKSNTHEHSYAFTLKVLLNETRLLFGEDELGHNTLPAVDLDYISSDLATHFVSSITYGGRVIVNFVARQSELSKEEKFNSRMLDGLKGVASLVDKVDEEIKCEFYNMDDKFDLATHSDVALDKIPTDPEDVLDVFTQAALAIGESGGVPISVTLQPISSEIYDGGVIIHQLRPDFVNDTLEALSLLDDLARRFSVLQNSVKALQNYIPELARTTHAAASGLTKRHNKLRHELAKFLQEYQREGKPPAGSIFEEGEKGGDSSDITGDKVLQQALKLYETHSNLGVKDLAISTQYPASLAGLEDEFSRFQHFAESIQKVGKSLVDSARSNFDTASEINATYLSNVKDILVTLGVKGKVVLLVMTPLTAANPSPDLAVAQYLALLREYVGFFEDSDRVGHLFYAEDLDILERRLPNDKRFSTLKKPSAFVGEINDGGQLTWAAPSCSM